MYAPVDASTAVLASTAVDLCSMLHADRTSYMSHISRYSYAQWPDRGATRSTVDLVLVLGIRIVQ